MFPDMKDMDDVLEDVEKIFKTEFKTAEMITDTFNEVYEMLLHLQGVISKAEFEKCFNKASEIFYLATGFKDQVQDCINQVQKRRVILGFNNKLNNVEGLFKNRTKVFMGNLENLVQGESFFNPCPNYNFLLLPLRSLNPSNSQRLLCIILG